MIEGERHAHFCSNQSIDRDGALALSLIVTSTGSAHADTVVPGSTTIGAVGGEATAAPAQDEQGRAVPILAIIAAAATVGGGFYEAGEWAGERACHAGLRTAEYQRTKWQVRGAVVGVFGLGGTPIVMTGFENKSYSLV